MFAEFERSRVSKFVDGASRAFLYFFCFLFFVCVLCLVKVLDFCCFVLIFFCV